MQFTKLRLVGFKSFVEAQEFVIERGLTGVVGPNGCGKSNLVEALRWVMGENSYKNMRASGMDDVIFSGSNTRPARNSAEVVLFLDNLDRTAPQSFNEADELQVSRRIEREAGSQYRINGKDVRAKDVQLLFADQSTGARSPSMVGQGRIGELIQAKPQARRALLEEAAGISGLHGRRHEAELRLRAAETNLDRLEDVVSDISSRMESLKRQSRQANRFKSLSMDIRQVEAGLFYVRWSESKTQEAEAESALNIATAQVAEQAQAHMSAQKKQESGKLILPELREEAAKAAAAHQRLTLGLRQLDEEETRNRQRQSELLRRIEQLSADITREEQLSHDNVQMLERLVEEEQILLEEAESKQENEFELIQRLEELKIILDETEQVFTKLTQKRAEIGAHALQLQQQVGELHQRLQRLDTAKTTINHQIIGVQNELSSIVDLKKATHQLDEAEEVLQNTQAAVQDGEAAVETARLDENQARLPVNHARDILQSLLAEERTLQTMVQSLSLGDYTPIVDMMSVEQGYETALGAALGDDLEAADDHHAPAFWSEAGVQNFEQALPEAALPLSAFVKAPKQLMRRLSQIGIVDAQQGGLLQNHLSIGQKLVSLDGALWRWDGLQARADAPTAAAQRLAQKNRLLELIELIASARQKVENFETILKQQEAVVLSASHHLRDIRDSLKTAHEKRDEAARQLSLIERQSGELTLRLSSFQENFARTENEIAEVKQQLEAFEHQLNHLPDLSHLESDLAKISSKRDTERSAVTQATAHLQSWKQNAQARVRRLEAIAAERKNWQQRIENATHHIEALKMRREDVMFEAENLAEIPDDLVEQRQALLSEINKAEALGHEVMDRLTAAENAANQLDKMTSEAFVALSHSREARARSEERLNAAMDRRKDIELRISETLNCDAIETIKLSGLSLNEKLPDIAFLEQKLDRLRIERERLGAVNLRAEEEEQELRARYDAMTVERDDIIEAIKKLRMAIQSLNKEGRERLLVAFEKVNTQFQRLFSHLFGGGTAELQLVESDDPLDAGLEILARPPGKKPQTMTLLSGGEQALTAMALIFAVFLTNPAPICVLDEVDAPLDDHNVERYCNLLDEMASLTATRFVVITHNPITMARMNRLFGVTMGEQGVSQLVSVDLQTAEKLRESDLLAV